MQRLLAITFLTLRAAIRYKLALALSALLAGTVVVLPLIIKDDSTARGMIQILLTYTLSVVTFLLGFTTLWLSCGSLAREIEECQMQVIATKPVARWQIWLGKWLGIMTLNVVLLAFSGAAVYGLLQYRAQKLPEPQREVLEKEIFVARGSLKEKPIDLRAETETVFQEYLKRKPISPGEYNLARQQVAEVVKAQYQIVRPMYQRVWKINVGNLKDELKNAPLTMRVRFTIADPNHNEENPKTYPTYWSIGKIGGGGTRELRLNLASDTFHEIPLPTGMIEDDGTLTIACSNPTEDTDMLFLLENGMEVLYRESGFGINYVRGLLIIAFWLGLLAAIGLSAASFLSFPVASFLALGILVVGFSTGTLTQVIAEGGISGVNHETGKIDTPRLIDQVAMPFFKAMLKTVKMVREFTPIESLSSGRSITWLQLGMAFTQIVVIMGGAFAAFGIYMFTRRELATAQGGQ